MDLLEVVRLVREHAWLPLAALVIGFLVRLLKSDVKFMFDVPAKYRPLAAIILGLAAAAVDRVIGGAPAKEALTEGLSAAALAIAGHVLGIEWLRGGKEITVGADKPKGPPPNIPSTIPVSLMLALSLSGCSLLRPKSALDWAQATCIAANAFLDVPALRQVCPSIQNLSDADVNQLLSAARQGGARYAAQRGATQ